MRQLYTYFIFLAFGAACAMPSQTQQSDAALADGGNSVTTTQTFVNVEASTDASVFTLPFDSAITSFGSEVPTDMVDWLAGLDADTWHVDISYLPSGVRRYEITLRRSASGSGNPPTTVYEGIIDLDPQAAAHLSPNEPLDGNALSDLMPEAAFASPGNIDANTWDLEGNKQLTLLLAFSEDLQSSAAPEMRAILNPNAAGSTQAAPTFAPSSGAYPGSLAQLATRTQPNTSTSSAAICDGSASPNASSPADISGYAAVGEYRDCSREDRLFFDLSIFTFSSTCRFGNPYRTTGIGAYGRGAIPRVLTNCSLSSTATNNMPVILRTLVEMQRRQGSCSPAQLCDSEFGDVYGSPGNPPDRPAFGSTNYFFVENDAGHVTCVHCPEGTTFIPNRTLPTCRCPGLERPQSVACQEIVAEYGNRFTARIPVCPSAPNRSYHIPIETCELAGEAVHDPSNRFSISWTRPRDVCRPDDLPRYFNTGAISTKVREMTGSRLTVTFSPIRGGSDGFMQGWGVQDSRDLGWAREWQTTLDPIHLLSEYQQGCPENMPGAPGEVVPPAEITNLSFSTSCRPRDHRTRSRHGIRVNGAHPQ